MKRILNLIFYIFIILMITACSNKEVKEHVFNSETMQNEDNDLNENPIDKQHEDFSNDISIYELKNEELHEYFN
jgi:hypothetical protein